MSTTKKVKKAKSKLERSDKGRKSRFKFKDQAIVKSGFYKGRIVTILGTEPQIECYTVTVPPTCHVRFESGNVGYIFEKYLKKLPTEPREVLKRRKERK